MVTKGTKMGKGQVRELVAVQNYVSGGCWARLLLLDIPVLLRIPYQSWRRGLLEGKQMASP